MHELKYVYYMTIFRTLTIIRALLDATHLGSDEVRIEANPYFHLTEIINNYSSDNEFSSVTQNTLCVYANGVKAIGSDGKFIMVKGIAGASMCKFDAIFEELKDLDPCHPQLAERPCVEPDWLEKRMKKHSAVIGKVYANFTLSGNYSGGDTYTEWKSFCNGQPSWVLYALTVIDHDSLTRFCKKMPENQARDTGISGELSPSGVTVLEKMTAKKT